MAGACTLELGVLPARLARAGAGADDGMIVQDTTC
jgi:hypothetical protein